MSNKWVGLLFMLIIKSRLHTTIAFEDDDDDDDLDSKGDDSSQVELRSVFINCEADERNVSPPDSEATRFEREELFKHSVLRDCNKKLALTVKITSEPDSSGDEYLPIEHVFEGANKKRIRLLDPYILRLRRESPLQAYKLRRVDTISGVLIDTSQTDDRSITENYRHVRSRKERDLGHLSKQNGRTSAQDVRRIQTTTQGFHAIHSTTFSNSESIVVEPRSCVKKRSSNIMCPNTFNTTLGKRKKRNEHNIVVEEVTDDKQWNSKDHFYGPSEPDREHDLRSNSYGERTIKDENHRRPVGLKKETGRKSQLNTDEKFRSKKTLRSKFRLPYSSKDNTSSRVLRHKLSDKFPTIAPLLKAKDSLRDHSTISDKVEDRGGDYRILETEEGEKDYAVYEIGNPELWYTVHVQLFEKLSTPDGKTVWNDLTKGEQASVSSTSPEWRGQDLNVRYRPAEWIPREEFSLPSTSLCLLAPIRGAINSYADYNNSYFNGMAEDGGFIVVPEEDVVGLKDDDDVNINKRNDNITDSELISKPDEQMELGRRKVVVRTSRALLGGTEEKVNIAYHGSEKYLTLPHKRPHHAQIDLEARADENELVRVGASGRIAIAVADSTRRTRTIITMQVGNTGLAAARFRIVTRECGPALTELIKDKSKAVTVAGPVLIPPRHTRSMRLELPVEIPIDLAHCSVTLMNDEDKSVAVRDVTIKKGDRCFCVWHCDCVCLSDDPKLLCREMADSRQSAAGLSTRDRTRHARSACCKDVITLNIFVVFLGVIISLLLIGFVKAVVGLVIPCIGQWGLELQLELPRKLDHYYEPSLKCRNVEYDCEGYPVHPDTKDRTVRIVSRPMEFLLNLIFFITVPCIVAYEAIKHMIKRFRACKKSDKTASKSVPNYNNKKCFSSHDMQECGALRWRRRRGGLRRWMTNEAQELSKELWKEGLTPYKCEIMRPLIRDVRNEEVSNEPEHADSCCGDSEQDDTDYVLSQMQKSRESLSILKQKSKP